MSYVTSGFLFLAASKPFHPRVNRLQQGFVQAVEHLRRSLNQKNNHSSSNSESSMGFVRELDRSDNDNIERLFS